MALNQRCIFSEFDPVVLVGHSWGGAVITQAGNDDKVKALVMAATQGPAAIQTFGDKVSAAAWKSKTNYYIVAEEDRVIQPELEKSLAAKIGAKTTILQSSHVPMLSQPESVANVILEAVDSLQK